MNTPQQQYGMGWLPDYPDFRDFSSTHETIAPLLKTMKANRPGKKSIKSSVDLRQWCSPIEDQGELGSCTANAGTGIVEYFERRAFGKHIDASRLFLYKVTRNLAHLKGDSGAYLRSTMGALVLFGIPPEEYWPYVVSDYEKEPPAFCYAFAQNYQAIKYYRLDPPNTTVDVLLTDIKTNLASGLPLIFGFTVYNSISHASSNGRIPFPSAGEKVAGGHAVVAVGYNDEMKIRNESPGGQETVGALLIRNSWGTEWGENGYGWLPYEYVLKGLAIDWWSLIKMEWIETDGFKI
ncbi:MAG: C1 family peptidase [Bacteroidota bacterium]